MTTSDSANAASDLPRPRQKRAGRPTGLTAEDTRRSILDAARHCFANKGFAGTSSKEIAIRAGITAAALRYYFNSKAELYLAVYADLNDVSISRCRNAVRTKSTMRDAIIAMLDNLRASQPQPPDVLRFMAGMRSEAACHPEIAGCRDDSEWRSLFETISRLGVQTGEISPQSELGVRAMLATLVAGLGRHAADAPHRTHVEALNAFKLLIGGKLFGNSS